MPAYFDTHKNSNYATGVKAIQMPIEPAKQTTYAATHITTKQEPTWSAKFATFQSPF